MQALKKYYPWVLSLFIAFVFVQSLFFKFADAAEPAYIFSTLDQWAEDSFGVSGLFLPGGIFSQYVIGSAELVASLLLLVGIASGGAKGKSTPALMHMIGAAISLAIISGAIFFHLFTPLGVVIADAETGVANDGGALFIMAIGVWVSSAVLLYGHRDLLGGTIGHKTVDA